MPGPGGYLNIHDPVPTVSTPVGPIAASALQGLAGFLEHRTPPVAGISMRLPLASRKAAIVAEMLNLDVEDDVPHPFDKRGYHLQMWIKGKSGGGGTTVDCLGCGVPTVLTLSWYWVGQNQEPCTNWTGSALPHEYGPLTSTLTYDGTKWVAPWEKSPCWRGDLPFGFGTPSGCLYHRFTWQCVSGLLFVDFSDTLAGTVINSCGAGQEVINQNEHSLPCSPFVVTFPHQDPAAAGFGTPMFSGGVLSL